MIFYFNCFLFPVDTTNCFSIEIYSSSCKSAGVYLRNPAFTASAQKNPVWKHPDEDRYIFNTGSSIGWRVGRGSELDADSYSYTGKNVHSIF